MSRASGKSYWTVAYQFSCLGPPVWRTGINIRLFRDELDIVSASSTLVDLPQLPALKLNEKKLDDPANKRPLAAAQATIDKALETAATQVQTLVKNQTFELVDVHKANRVVFWFDQAQRVGPEHQASGESHLDPEAKLPKVQATITSQSYRLSHADITQVR